jgi:hypothetical protein
MARDAGLGSSADAGTRPDDNAGDDENEPGGGEATPGSVFDDEGGGCELSGPRSDSQIALAALGWCAVALWLTRPRRS